MAPKSAQWLYAGAMDHLCQNLYATMCVHKVFKWTLNFLIKFVRASPVCPVLAQFGICMGFDGSKKCTVTVCGGMDHLCQNLYYYATRRFSNEPLIFWSSWSKNCTPCARRYWGTGTLGLSVRSITPWNSARRAVSANRATWSGKTAVSRWATCKSGL